MRSPILLLAITALALPVMACEQKSEPAPAAAVPAQPAPKTRQQLLEEAAANQMAAQGVQIETVEPAKK